MDAGFTLTLSSGFRQLIFLTRIWLFLWGRVWAAGTGYGSHRLPSTSVWNPQESQAAQMVRDAEMESIIQELTNALEPVIRESMPRIEVWKLVHCY